MPKTTKPRKTARPKRTRKTKPLIVEHDGQSINVDEVMLNSFVEEMDGLTLPELLGDLEAERIEHAKLLTDHIKQSLTLLPDARRAEAISICNIWIETHANGRAQQMRDVIGLVPNEFTRPADPVVDEAKERLILEALEAAEKSETTGRRDELVKTAIFQLASLNNPLAADRWRPIFLKRLGVIASTFNQLLKQAQTGDDGDPIRALINEAAVADDTEAALRKLFEALANLTAFEQMRYTNEVMQRLSISETMFNRMLNHSRKAMSRSAIIDGQLTELGEPLCNWSAHITDQNMVHDGMTQPRVTYIIEAKLSNGKSLPKVELDAEDFEDVKGWTARHWGADPISYVQPSHMYRIARAIKDLSRSNGMRRNTVYTFTGWTTIEGDRAYLTASGAITKDGLKADVRVDLGENRLSFYELPAPPEGDELKAAAKASFEFLYLAPLRVTAPLWASMYGAPLIGEHSLNSMLWVYGPTQSGKSTITMLALTHLGPRFIKGREYYAPADWISTVTDIEYNMFTIKDAPLVVDDYAPQSNAGGERDMQKKVERTIRALGNRAGRGRRNSDGSARRTPPPRGLVISTAELPLDVQSIVGRMIYIPVEPGEILGDDKDIDKHQDLAGPGSGLYAKAFAGYIRWLATNWDREVAAAKVDHERASRYARGVFPSTQSRMIDYHANLVVYANAGLRFMHEVGAIKQEEARAAMEEKFPAAFVELLQLQSVRVAEQSPVLKLLEAVEAMLISRKAHFEPRLGSTSVPPAGSITVGYWDDDSEKAKGPVLYLLTGLCLDLARAYWQRLGSNLNATKDSIHRQMDQASILAYREEKQIEVSEWASSMGKTTRMVALEPTRTFEKYGVDIWPGVRIQDKPAPQKKQ